MSLWRLQLHVGFPGAPAIRFSSAPRQGDSPGGEGLTVREACGGLPPCPNIALPSLSATAIQAPRVRAALLATPPTRMLLRVAPPPSSCPHSSVSHRRSGSFQQPPRQPSLALLASVFQGSSCLSNLLMTRISGVESWFGSDLQGTHEFSITPNPEDTEHRQG